MARIHILGGTGYAGTHVAREAASRGHDVTAYSRNAPAEPVDGVHYQQVDVLEPGAMHRVVADADVVIDTLSPRGELEGRLEEVRGHLISAADAAGVRLGVLGGAGSLHVSEGGPMFIDTPDFPEVAQKEGRVGVRSLEELRSAPESLDWFLISPAATFGSFNPGERTGSYRVTGDLLQPDENGVSTISGPDLGIAFVDEIEQPRHHRQRFGVAQ